MGSSSCVYILYCTARLNENLSILAFYSTFFCCLQRKSTSRKKTEETRYNNRNDGYAYIAE